MTSENVLHAKKRTIIGKSEVVTFGAYFARPYLREHRAINIEFDEKLSMACSKAGETSVLHVHVEGERSSSGTCSRLFC